MQRSSFDAIMREMSMMNAIDGIHRSVRFSLRNGEAYSGGWRTLDESPDVIVVGTAIGDVFIALTAIATIGRGTR